MKKILGVYNAPGQHWVGDGFPVRSLFSYDSHGRHIARSCCWTMPARRRSRRPPTGAVWASIRTAASRR